MDGGPRRFRESLSQEITFEPFEPGKEAWHYKCRNGVLGKQAIRAKAPRWHWACGTQGWGRGVTGTQGLKRTEWRDGDKSDPTGRPRQDRAIAVIAAGQSSEDFNQWSDESWFILSLEGARVEAVRMGWQPKSRWDRCWLRPGRPPWRGWCVVRSRSYRSCWWTKEERSQGWVSVFRPGYRSWWLCH